VESRFRILGRTRILVGDHFEDRWAVPKPRGILAVLLLHPRRSMPFEKLVEWVWPDLDEPVTTSTLHSYKKRIVAGLAQMAQPPRIIADGGAYRIEVDDDEVDYFQFRKAAKRARGLLEIGSNEAAIATIEPALELWNDIPLADPQGEPARNWRQWALTEHLLPAHDILMRALSALSRYDEVLQRLADLPLELQSSLMLVRRKLEALHGQGTKHEASAFLMSQRKRFKNNFDHEEADDLLRFSQELEQRGHSRPAARPEDTAPAPDMLPRDITGFTGRADLLSQLDAMTTTTSGDIDTGIVLVSGPPGVGKTTLAVHWAHRVADRFSGGRLYADLGGFSGGPKADATEVVDTFLAALDFPVERIRDSRVRAAKLRALLAGRKVLALIENVARAADVLPLLDCLSGCLIVITSRRSLTGLTRRGAVNLPVPTLDYPEAKDWLARRVGPRARQDPDAVAHLTAICAGIPLALSNVADHVAIRPRVRLTEFVEELRDTKILLGLGHTSDESIQTVLSWSYLDLAPDERHLFRVLGLHPGPDIGLDVAAALSGRPRETTHRHLDALVVANLLTQPESLTRYRFHDLIRKYATETATAKDHDSERTAAETRLLSFYLHTAHNADAAVFPFRPRDEIPPLPPGVVPLTFENDETAMAWCVRERANINAIIEFAVRRSRHGDVLSLTSFTGEILQRVGYHSDAIGNLTMAVQAAREIGDPEREGDALANLAFVYLNLRDLSNAERCLRDAEERFRAIGSEFGGAAVTHHLARLHVEQGQYVRAIGLYTTALTAFRELGIRSYEVHTQHRLAEAHRRSGNLDAAMISAREGLYLAEHTGDQRGQALCLAEIAYNYYEQGDCTSAKSYCTRALAAHVRLHDVAQIGKTYLLLGTIHRDDGEFEEAEHCAREAIRYSHAARDPRDEASAYRQLGDVLHAQAQQEEAEAAWSKALSMLDDVDAPLAGAVRAQLAEIVDIQPRVPLARTEPLTPQAPQDISKSDY
jgi:tetratricopeptide (TPR) repeat protein